ncbi:MAG: ABC transporter substrate-binding protein [Candidatus Acidiferrales bacterium]
MKLRLSLFLAAISLALATVPAETARRPRYGGALRVEIGAGLNSLDPRAASTTPDQVAAKDQIDALIYERRDADGTFSGEVGSGLFQIGEWEPGKHATLSANENAPGGRPFVDSIQIQMGRAARDMLLDLELSKTDLAEVPVEQARRAADRGVRVSISQPDDLLALVYPVGSASTDDAHVREAIACVIDRDSIVNFILQKTGEPAGGLLPQWSSGTAFLFPTAADPARAKELWAQIAGTPKLVLGYDSGDPLEQSVAERIVVNTREAGISLVAQAVQSAASVPSSAASSPPPSPDARLIRLRMSSSLPRAALSTFLATLGPITNIDASALPDPASPQDIYDRERAVVSTFRVVPLVWLPQVYGLSARVRNWKAPGPGETWPLADVWLDGPPEAAAEKANP